MNNQPIIITPEQIVAAAQKIVDSHDDAWGHTADEYLAATEHWLRSTISSMLIDPAHYANSSGSTFSLSLKCQWPRCDEPALSDSPYCESHNGWHGTPETATELVMPPAMDIANSLDSDVIF